jgi:uncharacterized protein
MEPKLTLENQAKTSDVKAILLYLFLFYFAWSLKELWLVEYIHLFNETIAAFLTALVKISVWILLAWLYIKYYLNISPANYLKINVNVKKGVFWGGLLSLLLGLRFVFEVYVLHKQTFHFALPLDSYLNVFLLAGITEEIVFRGFILQEINKRMSFWKANVITSLLFLVIHYAVWIYNGEFFDLWGHMYVFILGLIFGYVYRKTTSLWSVVILHSFHNLFVIIS